MKIRSFRAGAAGLAMALALGAALPALAEGADASQSQAGGAPQVDRRGIVLSPEGGERRGNMNADRGYRPSFRDDRDRPRFDRGFERRGSYAYYNGHRGYRSHRHGYREHNGWWFPLAAFAAGAPIAGAAQPAPVYVAPNPHVDWCARTYRSYNPYDNTFQPYYGPRQYCISPYS